MEITPPLGSGSEPPPGPGSESKAGPEAKPKAKPEAEVALDFSHEKTKSHVIAPVEGGNYDPRPGEDAARRWIAFSLIAILGSTIFLIFLLLFYSTIQIGEIKEFSVILGPLITLVSAATGFYYGTKVNK